MRKIRDFFAWCASYIVYAICFAISFIYNVILYIPFAFVVIICAIVICLFFLPLAIVILLRCILDAFK